MNNEKDIIFWGAGTARTFRPIWMAEELGISLDKVKTIIADTNSLGHNDVTDGSRVTFAVGLATIKAAKSAKKEL